MASASPHIRTPRVMEISARICSLAVMLLGAIVLAGWCLGIPSLIRLGMSFKAMAPNTALSFLGLGLAMIANLSRSQVASNVARVVTIFLGLLSASRILEYLTGIPPNVDRWFFPYANGTYGIAIVAMSLPTAIAMVSASITIVLLMRSTRNQVISVVSLIFASLTVVSGMVFSLAYFFAEPLLYGPGQVPIALPTALGFVMLGAALVLTAAGREMSMRSAIIEQLQLNEQQYRAVVEQASEGIFLVDAGNFLVIEANPALSRLLGYSHEELKGRPIHQFVSDTPENVDAQMRLDLQATSAAYDERKYRRKDGSIIDVGLSMVAISYGGWHGLRTLVQDITQRKRAELERDRFFMLSRDLVCVAGFDGFFKRVNPAFVATLGFTAEELTSKPWLYFVHPDDRPNTEEAGKKNTEGSTVLNFENRYRCKDGSYRWILWTAVPVIEDGLVYAMGRDVTQRKLDENRLEVHNRALSRAVESERDAHEQLKSTQSQLVQAEKLSGLGQMVAGVAHEINNPLSFVGNNVSVLQRDLAAMKQLLELYRKENDLITQYNPEVGAKLRELSEKIDLDYTLGNLDEMLDRSREGLRRIQQIVKDLRDFARLDQGELQEADINAGVQSTANIILGRAKKKQVQIDLQLATLPTVMCYPAKINQVVMNLLSNAIDASEPNSTVTVSTYDLEEHILIQVADTGKGIDPSIRAQIFDPFFTTKPQGEGTGLGLSISYGIVKDHHGRIDVSSTPGQGTTFSVYLPLNLRAAAVA